MSDVLVGLNDHIQESTLRNRLELYLRSFILAVASYELIVFGKTNIAIRSEHLNRPEWGPGLLPPVEEIASSKGDLIMSLKSRIEGWRQSKSYLYYQKVCVHAAATPITSTKPIYLFKLAIFQEFESYLQNRFIKDVDVEQIIGILADESHKLSDDNLIKLFMCLNDVLSEASEEQVLEFLQYLCYKSRCLLPISYGLFHSRWEVRYSATKICCKLSSTRVRVTCQIV